MTNQIRNRLVVLLGPGLCLGLAFFFGCASEPEPPSYDEIHNELTPADLEMLKVPMPEQEPSVKAPVKKAKHKKKSKRQNQKKKAKIAKPSWVEKDPQ